MALNTKQALKILMTTGVRINELLSIELTHIDRANMVIHILHGKGGKMRQVTLKPMLLTILETYYWAYKPKKYLFENPSGGKSRDVLMKNNLKKTEYKNEIPTLFDTLLKEDTAA